MRLVRWQAVWFIGYKFPPVTKHRASPYEGFRSKKVTLKPLFPHFLEFGEGEQIYHCFHLHRTLLSLTLSLSSYPSCRGAIVSVQRTSSYVDPTPTPSLAKLDWAMKIWVSKEHGRRWHWILCKKSWSLTCHMTCFEVTAKVTTGAIRSGLSPVKRSGMISLMACGIWTWFLGQICSTF